jgi:hypothetical protein
LTFLGIYPDEALLKFHLMHDAEYDGEGKLDPASQEIVTSSDNRYVMMDAEIPNELYVHHESDEGRIWYYSDFPLKIVEIDTDRDSYDPTIITEEDVLPIDQLMKEEEMYLNDEVKVIAEWERLRVISTFHDYQIELMAENHHEVMATHGMGDGTDGEFNAGTFGHQCEVQSQLEAGYHEYLEAYFPDFLDADGNVRDPLADSAEDEMGAMNL